MDTAKLKQFHAQHFPKQPIPQLEPSNTKLDDCQYIERPTEDAEDLGHYDDGVKRTLTHDQIAMFRSSEIQRLLAQRRRQEEQDSQQDLPEQIANLSTLKAARNGGLEGRRQQKRFLDDDKSEAQHVDSLVYEEDLKQDTSVPNQFMWPKLGQ